DPALGRRSWAPRLGSFGVPGRPCPTGPRTSSLPGRDPAVSSRGGGPRMCQFLLDTDHLTLLEHGCVPLIRRVLSQPGLTVAVSAVTVEEAMRGRLGYLARPLDSAARVRAYALLVGTLQLLNQLVIVPFDHACEGRFQHLRAAKLGV